MDTHLIPSPVPGRLLLLVAPDSAIGALTGLMARLALQGPLYVLDGGNSFQGYHLARMLRRQTEDIAAPLERVLLSRAFTCYQVAALLEEGEFAAHPILFLDFLSTFGDQGVRVADRRRLLRLCIRRLQEISRHAPVAVWVRQRSAVPQEVLGFLEDVQAAAGQVWFPPRPPALPSLQQPALFPL